MAKSRFPGKALKLNLRKRIRFRDDFEPSPEDIRATQIINGLKLFRNVFGDSDEDYDFEGFTIHNEGERTSIAKYQCIKALNTNSSLEEERLARNSNVSPSIENGSFINLNEPGDCPEGSKGFLNGPPKLSLIDQLKLERRTNMLHKLHQNRNLSKVQLKKLTLKNNAIIAKRAQLIRQRKLLSGKGKMKRKFILPSISVRSSRIIKPNKRLFSDITAICSTTGQEDVNKAISESDKKVLRPKKEIEPLSDETTEKDEVCRSINLYTDSLTERGRGQVGRPPKRITRRIDNTNEDAVGIDDQLSPHKHPKEDRVKEKIEKLLRSPWHNRLKHSKKDKEEEGPSLVPSGAASKTILRKARLNLNKKTLQKIRSPSSVRRLIPPLEEDSTDTKCTICKNGESVIRRYGAPCCVTCDTIIAEFIEGSSESLSCIGRQGECQLVGLSADERCLACWLARMLLHCTVPSLLHDRLRKQLPSVLKDRVPTSLGLSNSIHLLTTASEMELPDHSKRSLSTETSSNIFGSVIDLPGGWKRKIGNELTVISPSGEKFKTISKLEDYLNRQGVQADPRILFGYSSIKPFQNKDSSAFINFKPKLNDKMHVVFTTLPGGWTRRIKLRNAGVRVDTYVCSPDGRTFRSRKELSAYFSQIGKVDDIYKYFPVRSRSTDPSSANSTDNAETSTTEPCSSSDFCSEGSAEENTPGINSDADTDNRLMQTNSKQDSDSGNSCELLEDDDDSQSTHSELENRPNKNVSTSKFVRPAPKSRKFNGEHDIPISDNEIDLNDDDSGGHINLSFFNQSDDENSEHVAPSVNKNNHEVGQVDLSHFQTSVGNVEPKDTSIFSHQNSSFNKLDSTGEENVHKRLCSDKSLRNKKAEETELNTSSQIPMPENKNNIEGKKEAVNSFAPIDDESTKYIRVSFRDFLARSLPKPDKDKSDKTSSKKNKKKKKKKKMKKTKSEKVVDKVSKNDKINSNDKLKCVPPLDLNTLVDTKNEVPNDIPRPVSICEEAAPPLPNKMAANIEAMSEEEALPVSPSEGSSVVKQQKKISLKKKVLVPSKKKKLKRPIVEKKKLAKKAKKVKKPSAFTTERFGGDWSRKIRWGENGNGKVSFLTSPDGQKIVSKIELLAYFKKAGKSVFNMEHYFPDNLIRSQIENTSKKSQEENASKEHDASQKEVDKSPKAPNSSKMEGKKKIGLRVHLPMKRTSNLLTKLKKRKMKFDRLHNKDCDNTTIGNSGPRVKHVCRSQAQVLGMARAVFPDQMTDKMDMSKKKKWCNKCPGCTTPNCKKCISCMNMKKFGGPGTFKKPCVKRKCLNPKYCSDTVKKYIPRKMKSQASGNSLEVLAPEILNCGPHLREENNAVAETVNKGREVPNKDSVTHKEISTDDDETCLDKAEGSDIGRDSFDEEETNITELEKSVFVPRQMPKTSDNKDQRADIQMGKEITPGATVNIDYWQGYDAEEMLLYGFPIITSGVSNHRSYCFRCGSKGKEELFYCAYCCEGVHPFCLEEGEGPESETEEEFWICRRCIMCHICGSPGHDNLLQCSSCRMYYHLECLGPSSHSSCQSSIGQPWESDALGLIALSWPRQTPIIDVGENADIFMGDVRVYEELERLTFEEDTEPEFYPLNQSCVPNGYIPLKNCSPSKQVLVESVYIEPTITNLEEEEGSHICLEDEFYDLEDTLREVDEVIELYRNVDISRMPSVDITKGDVDPNVCSMGDEEYLSLGYSKIRPFEMEEAEMSCIKLLQLVHEELFSVLDYPLMNEKVEDKLSRLEDVTEEKKVKSVQKVLNKVMKARRSEISQYLKESEELRIWEERRLKELERLRKKRLQEESEICNECSNTKLNCHCIKPPEPVRRPKLLPIIFEKDKQPEIIEERVLSPISMGENFIKFDSDDERARSPTELWQPQSWEEFDALLAHSQIEEQPPKKAKRKKPSSNKFLLSPATEERAMKKLKYSTCSVKMQKLDLSKWDIPTPISIDDPIAITEEDELELEENSNSDSLHFHLSEESSSHSPDGIVLQLEEDSTDFNEMDTIEEEGQVVLELSSRIDDFYNPLVSTLDEQGVVIEESNDLEFTIDEESSGIEVLEIEEPGYFMPHLEKGIQIVDVLPKAETALEEKSDDEKPVPESKIVTTKRSRRSNSGRASQLASMRKALLDM